MNYYVNYRLIKIKRAKVNSKCNIFWTLSWKTQKLNRIESIFRKQSTKTLKKTTKLSFITTSHSEIHLKKQTVADEKGRGHLHPVVMQWFWHRRRHWNTVKFNSHQNTGVTIRLTQRASVVCLVWLVQNREIHTGEAEKRKRRGKKKQRWGGLPVQINDTWLSVVFAVTAVIECGWEF